MSLVRRGVVAAEESEIHDEPHVAGSRITVRLLHARVEEQGLSPTTVADRYDLDVAAVYEALAYSHRNPAEMRAVERQRERAAELAAEQSSFTPPEQSSFTPPEGS